MIKKTDNNSMIEMGKEQNSWISQADMERLM
jgi:hypothetical protein